MSPEVCKRVHEGLGGSMMVQKGLGRTKRVWDGPVGFTRVWKGLDVWKGP